jgi:hypothetical protein
MLGIPYDATHDGAWWRRWWRENHDRLPEAIRGAPLPRVSPAVQGGRPVSDAAGEAADRAAAAVRGR